MNRNVEVIPHVSDHKIREPLEKRLQRALIGGTTIVALAVESCCHLIHYWPSPNRENFYEGFRRSRSTEMFIVFQCDYFRSEATMTKVNPRIFVPGLAIGNDKNLWGKSIESGGLEIQKRLILTNTDQEVYKAVKPLVNPEDLEKFDEIFLKYLK